MPDQNFLVDYTTYTSGNEVNEHYHLWSAISVLSSVVSRKVWIDQGYFKVFPGLYVVLLGPPGNGKTTAMSIAKRMVREVSDIPFSGECQSKENLVKELTDYARSITMADGTPYIYTPMSLFVTELSQFIGIDPVKMIDLLVAIYDADVYDQRTQKHGIQTVEGPYLTLLGCTTPDWVTTYLKTDIITGGFSRRTIFVLEDWESNRRIPRPEITPQMTMGWKRCIDHCRTIKDIFGPMSWHRDAIKWYDHWYMTRVLSRDQNVAAFDKTKSTQMLKLGILLELAQGSMVLHEETLTTCLAMLDKVMVQLPAVFSGLGRNELASVSAKIENRLRRNGPMLEKQVIAESWSDATTAEIYQVLNHLIASGTVLRTVEKTTTPDAIPKTWLVLAETVRAAQASRRPSEPPPAATSSATVP